MTSKNKKASMRRLTLAEIRLIGRGGMPKGRHFLHAGHIVEALVRDLLEARKQVISFESAERQSRTLEITMLLKDEKQKLAAMVQAYQESLNRETAHRAARLEIIAEEIVEFQGQCSERLSFHREIMRQMALVLALTPNS